MVLTLLEAVETVDSAVACSSFGILDSVLPSFLSRRSRVLYVSFPMFLFASRSVLFSCRSV